MTTTADITVSWSKGSKAVFYFQTEKGKSVAKQAKYRFANYLLNTPCTRAGLRAYDLAAPDAWAADIWDWLEENGASVEREQTLEYLYDEDGVICAAYDARLVKP